MAKKPLKLLKIGHIVGFFLTTFAAAMLTQACVSTCPLSVLPASVGVELHNLSFPPSVYILSFEILFYFFIFFYIFVPSSVFLCGSQWTYVCMCLWLFSQTPLQLEPEPWGTSVIFTFKGDKVMGWGLSQALPAWACVCKCIICMRVRACVHVYVPVCTCVTHQMGMVGFVSVD